MKSRVSNRKFPNNFYIGSNDRLESKTTGYYPAPFQNNSLLNKTKSVKKRKLQFPAGRAEELRCKDAIPTPNEFKVLVKNRIGIEEINNKSYKVYKSSEQTKILVMAQHRTGSSFFSELFNLHPEVFYLFEPLYQMEFREPEIVNPKTYRV